MIKKPIKLFDIFLLFFKIINEFHAIYIKACKQKSEQYLKENAHLLILKFIFIYFLTDVEYFLLNSIEIAERSNLIFPAPVSIVIVFSAALTSAILP